MNCGYFPSSSSLESRCGVYNGQGAGLVAGLWATAVAIETKTEHREVAPPTDGTANHVWAQSAFSTTPWGIAIH